MDLGGVVRLTWTLGNKRVTTQGVYLGLDMVGPVAYAWVQSKHGEEAAPRELVVRKQLLQPAKARE